MVVVGFNFFNAYLTFKSYTSYFAFFYTSHFIFVKTQGNKHEIIQLGTQEFFFATCLHRLLKDLNEESATMN
jgi:hypothetical protein